MAQPTYDSIIIAGQPYKLDGGVVVKTFDDPGGFSFEATRLERGIPNYGDRRTEKGARIKVKDKPAVIEVIKQVVIHTDLTTDARGCFNALNGRGLSTHFMIDWDGTIYQGLDVAYEAYHAAGVNAASIGVDMNNPMKNLEREPKAEPFGARHEWGDKNPKDFVRGAPERKRINGFWTKAYGYTDPQYQALLELLKVLTHELDIKPFAPLDETGEVVPTVLEDFAGFEGILAHWHISTSRWDPGPGFDWQRVYHGLAREHNAFPVTLRSNDNISSLLERKKVEDYAGLYYANNEQWEQGGWYPMGINQTWHGGVDLHPNKKGEPVLAMFDGVVVAARFGDKPTPIGHNNFMVLRHEVEIPTRQRDQAKKLVFYTLYMHLAPMDVVSTPDPKTALGWVRKLHEVHADDAADASRALEGVFKDEDAEDGEEGEDDGDDLFVDDDDSESEYDTRGFLEVGLKLAAFKRGQIALVPWTESPLKVKSGEAIGFVGEFGAEDEWDPALHVEVFADDGWQKAIDMGTHGRSFVKLESDLGADLFVENSQILGLFEKSSSVAAKGSLVDKRVLDPGSIAELYNGRGDTRGERQWLRKAVTRHVSEWSDQVDWVLSLSGAEEWGDRVKDFKKVIKRSGIFRDALKQVLPFVWLSKEVATHIGLNTEEWDGVLYHFHPVHFLLWLTYSSSNRIQVVSKGMTKKQLLKRRKEEEKRAAEDEHARESDACQAAAIELDDITETDWSGELEGLLGDTDQGEWQLLLDDE